LYGPPYEAVRPPFQFYNRVQGVPNTPLLRVCSSVSLFRASALCVIFLVSFHPKIFPCHSERSEGSAFFSTVNGKPPTATLATLASCSLITDI
jgi:hypothetical protein